MKIGFIVKETTYLKLLQPLISKAQEAGINFILYTNDVSKDKKEYNRPTKDRIQKSFQKNIAVCPYTSDVQLLQRLVKDRIDTIVSVELGLWIRQFSSFFKSAKIKTYSIQYLTDSLWQGGRCFAGIDRIYYSAKYIKNMQLKFAKITESPDRDRLFGSPLFDGLGSSTGEDTLVLLPNLREEHVKSAFGSKSNFIKLIESLGTNLIFKTRKKQWFPDEIKRLAKDIIYDGECMYPSALSNIFPRTKRTVLFYSSGIFEAVCAGQYVVNVKLPLGIWKWEKNKLLEYFSGEVYNYNGVVESVDQSVLLSGKLLYKELDETCRNEWINKFIGDIDSSSDKIIKDILRG